MKTLLAPDIVTNLGRNEVFVFPTSAIGPKVRGSSAMTSLKVMKIPTALIPRIGAKDGLYGIRTYRTPQRGDIFDGLQDEIKAFLEFANHYNGYLFIMSRDGWTKGEKCFIQGVDEFIKAAASIGNIAISEKVYSLGNTSMITERVKI